MQIKYKIKITKKEKKKYEKIPSGNSRSTNIERDGRNKKVHHLTRNKAKKEKKKLYSDFNELSTALNLNVY